MTDRQINRQTNRQTDKQTDRQTARGEQIQTFRFRQTRLAAVIS